MVSSWKESKKFIREPEPENILLLRDSADTLDQVNEEVQDKAECPRKYYGSEDKECWGDCWRNTEHRKKLIGQSITSSILLQRVTSSKTKPFSSSPSSRKNPKRLKPKNSKPSNKLEDKRTLKKEEKEPKNGKPFDLYLNHNPSLKYRSSRSMNPLQMTKVQIHKDVKSYVKERSRKNQICFLLLWLSIYI